LQEVDNVQKGQSDLATIAEIMLAKVVALSVENDRLRRKNKKLRKKLHKQRKASEAAKA